MSEWTVVLSARAESDLEQIYDYIAAVLLEPGTASAQVSRIRSSIQSLSRFMLDSSFIPESSNCIRVAYTISHRIESGYFIVADCSVCSASDSYSKRVRDLIAS